MEFAAAIKDHGFLPTDGGQKCECLIHLFVSVNQLLDKQGLKCVKHLKSEDFLHPGHCRRITAGWPTRHSIPNSSMRLRNQCCGTKATKCGSFIRSIDPVASMPTNTGRGSIRFTSSPVSVSNIANACWRACKSHPIIHLGLLRSERC